MRKRRGATTFNLAFLDVMSCGFGAVVLIFLIIDHASETQAMEVDKVSMSEVTLIEEDLRNAEENLVEAKNTRDEIDQMLAEMQGKSSELLEEKKRIEEERTTKDDISLTQEEHINKLRSDIQTLEQKIRGLRASEERGRGERARYIQGDGERQYLTGLRLGGKRTLILLDTSASMLDRTVVNIIRLRNMSESQRRSASKWQAAIGTVDWLTSQLGHNTQYQIYAFNTDTRAVLDNTEGKWLRIDDRNELDRTIKALGELVPEGGTSLENAFSAASTFSQLPDNIVLITDGLPTQGLKPGKGTVSGPDRIKLFNQALRALPQNVPINVLLAPMEGDPMAAAAFWQLAAQTRGSFMSPSKDWP